jgi:hypothetical protein
VIKSITWGLDAIIFAEFCIANSIWLGALADDQTMLLNRSNLPELYKSVAFTVLSILSTLNSG